MKHFELFKKSLSAPLTYSGCINQAVQYLNLSITSKRGDTDPTHQEERKAIIGHIVEQFPDKTEEEVVVDIVNHLSIRPESIEDFMYFHHRDFPGHKACIVPANSIDAAKLGLHISAHIVGEKTTGISHRAVEKKLEPAFTIGYFDHKTNQWSSFRVQRTDLYTMSKKFIEAFIAEELPFVHINSKNSDFISVMKYFREYERINAPYIPRLVQCNRIGWNAEKSVFISPRDKSQILVFENPEFQSIVEEGYVTKSTTGKTENINNMLATLKEYPLALAVYSSAYVAPIINGSILNMGGLTIDLHGLPGKGKSLLQAAALNPIGNSEKNSKLIDSWAGSSISGLSSLIAFHNSHVVVLEEGHLADSKVATHIVYNIHNSNMAVKASKDGQLRAKTKMSSILVSSGEFSLLNHITSSGSMRRILPINIADVFGDDFDTEKHEAFKMKLAEILGQNYGITIDDFVQYAAANKEKLQERFNKYKALYRPDRKTLEPQQQVTFDSSEKESESESESGNVIPFQVIVKQKTFDLRLLFDEEKHETFSNYIAAVHLVLDTLFEVFDISSITKEEVALACQAMYDYCYGLCISESKEIDALAELHSWSVTRASRNFAGDGGNGNQDQYGKFAQITINGIPEDVLIIAKKEVENFLSQKGYNASNTISIWKKLGVLHATKENKGTKVKPKFTNAWTRKHVIVPGGARVECYVFILRKVEQVIDASTGSANGDTTKTYTLSHYKQMKELQA